MALASEQHETVERVVMALTSSATTRLPAARLAQTAHVPIGDLYQLLSTHVPGLFERAGSDYKLAVRVICPFIEARSYLAASNDEKTARKMTS